ncbi:hypothetical protein MBGDC06_00430 [Thermoplasmatales archaeon SCGC AB-539-C06]|nr:hypothetical protein MBGDC06_00430 [Thermoplasmatales archaeon SCGC AB-539-C06]
MPAFFACSTISLFKRSVIFLLDIGRMTYVQKSYSGFGFGKKRVGKQVIFMEFEKEGGRQ